MKITAMSIYILKNSMNLYFCIFILLIHLLWQDPLTGTDPS